MKFPQSLLKLLCAQLMALVVDERERMPLQNPITPGVIASLVVHPFQLIRQSSPCDENDLVLVANEEVFTSIMPNHANAIREQTGVCKNLPHGLLDKTSALGRPNKLLFGFVL
jgi:hypothetical protein